MPLNDESNGSDNRPGYSGQQKDLDIAGYIAAFNHLHGEMSTHLEGARSDAAARERYLKAKESWTLYEAAQKRNSAPRQATVDSPPDSGDQVADKSSVDSRDAPILGGQHAVDAPAQGGPDAKVRENKARAARIQKGIGDHHLLKTSGTSIDYVRQHPREAMELARYRIRGPGGPTLAVDPMTLVIQAFEKGFITHPKTLEIGFRKHKLLGTLTWQTVINMFEEAHPRRFEKLTAEDWPGRGWWHFKLTELVTLALLGETLVKTGQSASVTPKTIGETPAQPVTMKRPTPPSRLKFSSAAVRTSEGNDNWPPDNAWHFRAGKFAFRGIIGDIKGVSQAILENLSKSRFGLAADQLSERPGKKTVGSSSLRSQISAVRSALRKPFGLKKKHNPIPIEGGGARVAWKLDIEMLKAAAKKKSIKSSGKHVKSGGNSAVTSRKTSANRGKE